MFFSPATLGAPNEDQATDCGKQRTASFADIINHFNWESLEIRRKEARLALLSHFSHNLIDISTDKFLQLNTETRIRMQ